MDVKFVKLLLNENGYINLTLDFEDDIHHTDVEFHITELKDWLYDNYEDFDEEDDIVDVSIIKLDGRKIEITTQKGNKYYIDENDELFLENFLNII